MIQRSDQSGITLAPSGEDQVNPMKRPKTQNAGTGHRPRRLIFREGAKGFIVRSSNPAGQSPHQRCDDSQDSYDDDNTRTVTA